MPPGSTKDTARAARAFYAEELRATTGMRSAALHEAFAGVPRERFVGPGPWRIKSIWTVDDYRPTPDDDPRHVYHDILIALDESRGFNNGQPSFWAFLLDALSVVRGERVIHLGCGTGYYTAILAELVGADGSVRAVDSHQALAVRAREALEPWPNVRVEMADGASLSLEQADVVVASAGVTRPPPVWLDALGDGGRLLVPMTSTEGPGAMLLVTRRGRDDFAARFLSAAAFVDFSGARDAATSAKLADAIRRDRGRAVNTLRRDPHRADETCWLHGDGWCLSTRR